MQDENERGWALLQKQPRSEADLDEARQCFERAIGAGNLPAVSNLGDTLLALGRADHAVMELDKLAREENAVAGRAHNWLGWYFLTREVDLERAIRHLETATRIDSTWGVAWLNLAKAYDAAGDLPRAAVAYGTAIERGDSHDDTYARDRRLQLEMQLLIRGETPPEPPDSAAPDSRAFAIVRDAAARLPTAHAFAIRPTQYAGGRLMPAIIGTVVGSRALGACIVDRGIHTLARDGDSLSFVDSPDLVPWVSALDADVVTPIDVALWIFDKLKEPDWSWAITEQKPAEITVWPPGIMVTARNGGGVTIRVGRASFDVTTPTAVLELEPALRKALAAEKARIHPGDLREGAHFRVLVPFGTLSRGEVATVREVQYIGRGDLTIYTFHGDQRGSARIQDYQDDEILRDLDRYLARHH